MASTQQPGGVSRRKALTGAGLVVAGAVAGATGGVLTTQLLSSDGAAGAQASPKLPVMIYLLDASAGRFEVFTGDRATTVVDTHFAAQLVKAANAA